MRHPSLSDRCLSAVDHAMKTVLNAHVAARPLPQDGRADPQDTPPLTDEERRLSAALMRVNHVGEVCAQALYNAQALTTRDPVLKAHFNAAAAEETDHLAWTEQRLAALGGRASLLNPVWYAGAFALGLFAGRSGDARSLGFVVETERQVEQHLDGHLARLPAADAASRAVVSQMRDDESRHALEAERSGASPLPWPVRQAMKLAARVMTTTAHHV